MDDDVLDDHLETDADSFGEWIEQVAASRDISEDEFLNQLMSSYWMMDELATVIDELDIEAGRRRPSDDASPGKETEPAEGSSQQRSPRETSRGAGNSPPKHPASGERYDDGVIALIDTLKDWKTVREEPESSSVDDNLIDLIKVIQEGNQAASAAHFQSTSDSSERPETDSGGVNETVQLIRALKDFSEGSSGGDFQDQLLNERKYLELEEKFDQLKSEFEGLYQAVENLDQSDDDRVEELAQELDRVSGRVIELDQALQDTAEERQVEKLQDAVNDLADRITSIQSEIESHIGEVEGEFEDIERILTHLFDEVEETGEETESLANRLASLQTRMQTLDEIEAAGKLKRKASRAGVSAADCESCGESVGLGQLTEPECPYCNHQFDELAEEKKWGFFSRHRLIQTDSDPGA